MMPASERLDRPGAAAAELHQWLEVRLDLAERKGLAQVLDEGVARQLGVDHARREHRAAGPPAVLRGVHREIGVAQELVGGAHPAAGERDPDARVDAHDVTLHAERREQRPQHALRGSLGLDRRGRVLEQHGELVAAHPRRKVVLAQRRAQPLRHRHEQGIAGGVPERVVHALEIVEVEEHHGRRVVVARQRGLDAQREQGAAGRPHIERPMHTAQQESQRRQPQHARTRRHQPSESVRNQAIIDHDSGQQRLGRGQGRDDQGQEQRHRKVTPLRPQMRPQQAAQAAWFTFRG